jgi:serpin B
MRTFVLPLALSIVACSNDHRVYDGPVPRDPAETGQSASSGAGAPATSSSTGPTGPTTSSSAPSQSDAAPKLAAPSQEEVHAAAKANNALGLDLYARIKDEPGNLALSPLSISTALTMAWAGAKGDTALEMQKTLHIEGPPERAFDAMGKVLAAYRDPSKKVTLRIANRLFGEKSQSFEAPFLDRTKTTFGAPLEALDFKGHPAEERTHINEWVSAQTNGRITNLLPSGSVKPETRLVLTNAIYFLGDWETPFKKESTQPAAFHPTGKGAHDVATMHAQEGFRYAHQDGVRLLDLPYQGGELAMTFVLPDKADGLGDVEAKLDPATLDRWMGAMKGTLVDVALPKVTIDPAEPIELRDALAALGMKLAFDPEAADLSGMAKTTSPKDKLFLSAVFHKAFVKVDEKGTEAAAATAIMAEAGTGAPTPHKAEEFHADHPYLFFLHDVRSNLVLFMGRVSDPG